MNLAQQRCFNHALREAAARCPECLRYYCRECITEHEDRVLCATCLQAQRQPGDARRRLLAVGGFVFQLVVGLFTAWLFFYLLGGGLLSLDAKVHEGSVWIEKWWEAE